MQRDEEERRFKVQGELTGLTDHTSATIKLFLPAGDAKGLRTAEISNWMGKALATPRTELDRLIAREEGTTLKELDEG